MNFQTYKKTLKLERIIKELETEQSEFDSYHPEAGADLRWSVISLRRAINLLKFNK